MKYRPQKMFAVRITLNGSGRIAMTIALLLALCGQVAAQDAVIGKIQVALGKNGIVTTANPSRHVSVEIATNPDEALRALGGLTDTERASVEQLVLRVPCTNKQSQRLIGRFSRLRILDVCKDGWGEGLTEVVTSTATLEQLWAEGAGISSSDLQRISSATSLKVMMVGNNRFDNSLGCIGDLENLTQLSIACQRCKSKDMAFVQRLPKITWLDLVGTAVDDEVVPILARCKSLKFVSLSDTKMTPVGVKELQEAIPDAIVVFEAGRTK